MQRRCRVSFSDRYQIRHSVEVTAESLFEAAALGLKHLSDHGIKVPNKRTHIKVEILPENVVPVVHTLTMEGVEKWVRNDFHEARNERWEKYKVILIFDGAAS